MDGAMCIQRQSTGPKPQKKALPNWEERRTWSRSRRGRRLSDGKWGGTPQRHQNSQDQEATQRIYHGTATGRQDQPAQWALFADGQANGLADGWWPPCLKQTLASRGLTTFHKEKLRSMKLERDMWSQRADQCVRYCTQITAERSARDLAKDDSS